MRTRALFALFALILAVALGASAGSLATFDYQYTDTKGVTATGTLIGNLVAPGEYNIVDGTIHLIDLANPTIDGDGVLAEVGAGGNFYTGGGTILTFFPMPDSDLYLNQNPQIDSNGAFVFDLTSGPGKGNGLAIWSNGPGNYGAFGGNWTVNDFNGGGSFTASVAPVPEPGSFLLFGTAGIGLCGIGLLKKRARSRVPTA